MTEQERLEEQLEKKVLPFCKENEIPFIFNINGDTTYFGGRREDILNGVFKILNGVIKKEVATPLDIVGMLALIESKKEKS